MDFMIPNEPKTNGPIVLEMELNHFPNLEGTPTLWEVTDPYLVGGMPLVDLVDLPQFNR